MQREAVIVAMSRTAVGKAKRGTTRNVRSDDLAGAVIRELLRQTEGKLDPARIDDVTLGCAYPEGPQGLNVARPAAFLGGLPAEVPAQTINRFCSSGLQAIALASERIIANGADVILAGGVESMSMVPMTGFKLSPNLKLAEGHPEVYMSMGLTAERVAEEYEVTREAQDEFALASQQKTEAAQKAGKFKDEIIPFEIASRKGTVVFAEDEFPRHGATLESLKSLKPAFDKAGSVTAGNASGINDGAAAVVLASARKASELGLKPLARIKSFSSAGVDPKYMGMGPVPASKRCLSRAGWTPQELDLMEINEAFAAQAIAVNRQMGWDTSKVNVNGGAIALGHPIGASGCRILVTLLHEMAKRDAKKGLASLCIGGGMGVALAVER